MTVSTWDESLETGNELIDRQHRELIAFLDELQEVAADSESDVLRMLDKVMDFTIYHFHSEEELMALVKYPAVPTRLMTEQHQEFKSYARLRVLEFRAGDMVSVQPLASFIEEFLKVHEFGMDRLLADWIREHNEAPADEAV